MRHRYHPLPLFLRVTRNEDPHMRYYQHNGTTTAKAHKHQNAEMALVRCSLKRQEKGKQTPEKLKTLDSVIQQR